MAKIKKYLTCKKVEIATYNVASWPIATTQEFYKNSMPSQWSLV